MILGHTDRFTPDLCGKFHPDAPSLAACLWPDARCWGEGPFAVIGECGGTVRQVRLTYITDCIPRYFDELALFGCGPGCLRANAEAAGTHREMKLIWETPERRSVSGARWVVFPGQRVRSL